MEKKKMMHVGIHEGDIGRYVFLPAVGTRTEKIAKYFEKFPRKCYNRSFDLDGNSGRRSRGGAQHRNRRTFRRHRGGRAAPERRGHHDAVQRCASTSPKVCMGDIVHSLRSRAYGRRGRPLSARWNIPAVADFQMMKGGGSAWATGFSNYCTA